jgi:hypothetical protein
MGPVPALRGEGKSFRRRPKAWPAPTLGPREGTEHPGTQGRAVRLGLESSAPSQMRSLSAALAAMSRLR